MSNLSDLITGDETGESNAREEGVGRHLLLFCGGLFRHWVVVVGGSVLAAVSLAWKQFHGSSIPTPWLWVSFGLGVSVAAFLTWRDEHRRAEEAEHEKRSLQANRPQASLKVVADGVSLCLDVHNLGGHGLFKATIETEGGAHRLHPVPAIWQQTQSDEPILIAPGLTARLLLAKLVEDGERKESPAYNWWLMGRRFNEDHWSLGRPVPLDDNAHQWCTLRVVVISSPEMQRGSAVRRIRFVGREAIDIESFDRHRPDPTILRDDSTPKAAC